MGLGLIDLLMLRVSLRDVECAPELPGLDIENPANDSAMRGGSVGIETGIRTSVEVLRQRRDANVGEVGDVCGECRRAKDEMGAQGAGAGVGATILSCEGRRVIRPFGGEYVSFREAEDERREEAVEGICSEMWVSIRFFRAIISYLIAASLDFVIRKSGHATSP